MTATWSCRRAGPADAEAIAATHVDSIRSIGPGFYVPEVVDAWASGLGASVYVNAMSAGEAFFIATGPLDGMPAVLGFSTHRADDAEDGMSVYVRGRAARRGIGSALLQLAETHASEVGATTLRIQASLAGVAFYARHGYEDLGRGEAILLSGRSMPCVFMEKQLQSSAAGELPVTIVEYRPELAPAFAALNRAWIERHFTVEALDAAAFADPARHIIEPGGQILFALAGGEVAGTCALIPHGPGTFELAKMAVAEGLRGRGVGDKLMTAAIAWCRTLGARRLVLVSNSKLTPALALYRKHGFHDVPVDPENDYARADVQMVLLLGPERG